MNAYGLSQSKLYYIPPGAVSYHPQIAGAKVWWTGELRTLPAGGGVMAGFRFAHQPPAAWGEGIVWLRPWAVGVV